MLFRSAGLSTLVQLQPDIVKLDMSLVRNIHNDEARQRVTGAMIDLAERLDMGVICEGVENAAERDHLALIGARLMQGFHFARPARSPAPVNWS